MEFYIHKDGYLYNGDFIEGAREVTQEEIRRELIDKVINQFGHMTCNELVQLTHKKGSLWDITTRENHINFDATNTTSDYTLDFTRIISDDELKLSNYKGAKETMMFRAQIKKC